MLAAPFVQRVEAPLRIEATQVLDRFEDDRRRQLLSRLQSSALLALIPIGFAAFVNALAFPDRVDERLASLAATGALCIAAVGLSRHPRAIRFAVPLSVGFAIALGSTLFWGLSLSPRDLDVLVGTVIALMIGSALLYPWGGVAQAVVSIFLASGFAWILPWSSIEHDRAVNVMIPLALGVGLSLIGAAILERRRRAHVKLVADLEEQGETSAALARVGQELISSLDQPVILDRLCRLTTEVMDCDVSHVFLWREEEQAFLSVRSHGEDTENLEILRVVRLPPEIFGDWLPRLTQDGIAQFVRGEPDPLDLFARQHRFSAILHVALRRGQSVIGFLTACRRSAEPFSEKKLRIARGVAQLASMALENSRLIDEVEGANRLKTDFVATISHELRTPLGIIMGYADLLLEEEFGSLGKEQLSAVSAVDRSSRQLFDLITSILDLSRLEAGKLPVDVREVSLAELVDEVCTEASDAHGKPNVQLVRSVAAELSTIETDVAKLKIIIKNLVVNALKFTEQGQVAVEARADAQGVLIDVVDTGIGMDSASLSIIFDQFRQVESCLTRSRGGLGLGLYIVKRLTDVLNGEISVESASGRGSAFHLRLPTRVEQRLDSTGEDDEPRTRTLM